MKQGAIKETDDKGDGRRSFQIPYISAGLGDIGYMPVRRSRPQLATLLRCYNRRF